MRNVLPVVLLVLASVSCMFGQSGQAAMSPTTVVAGKQITVTITLNKAFSEQGAVVGVSVEPKDPKDNAPGFGFSLGPKDSTGKVYTGSNVVALNAKGIWSIKELHVTIPNGGNFTLDTNHPEFTVTPVTITLPTKGDVVVTAP
jgi:hypothetical protein